MAASHLEALGYRILERNYRFKKAELDLICFQPADRYEDGGEIVFVEVKTRTTGAYGSPEAAVDREKQKNLIRAARFYLYERRLEGAICRFDVLAIDLKDDVPQIEHLKAAFHI